MGAEAKPLDRISRWRAQLDVLMTLAIVATCLTLIWVLVMDHRKIEGRAIDAAPGSATAARRTPPAVPKEPLSLAGAPVKGSRTAKVAIVQYSDFECPYCGKFATETLPLLERDYVRTGKVLLAFRHFPLESIHPSALIAAAGAECAARQDRFWELHDRLFKLSPPFTVPAVNRIASTVVVDGRRFATCLAGEALERVREDTAGGRELGVTGTPTFLIGRVQPDRRVRVAYWLSGTRPFAQFSNILDGLLKGAERNRPLPPK